MSRLPAIARARSLILPRPGRIPVRAVELGSQLLAHDVYTGYLVETGQGIVERRSLHVVEIVEPPSPFDVRHQPPLLIEE